jgi:hypothetical protein
MDSGYLKANSGYLKANEVANMAARIAGVAAVSVAGTSYHIPLYELSEALYHTGYAGTATTDPTEASLRTAFYELQAEIESPREICEYCAMPLLPEESRVQCFFCGAPYP